MSKLRSVLFSVLQRAYRLLRGKGITRIPGVLALSGFLFQTAWKDKRQVIEVEGSKMFVDPTGLPKSYRRTFQFYILGGHEELTTEMFKKVVKPGDTVLDLGANIGYFSLLAASLAGEQGRVYSFEPEPTNYSILCKNIELNGYAQITALHKAVSSTSGKVRLFVDSRDTGAHSIYSSGHGGNFVEVEAVALDDFFKNGQRVNVVKMDVEGAEMAVIQGMERLINQNQDLKMFIEFFPPGIRRRGDSPEEFARRLLEDYRFSILAIGEYTGKRGLVHITSVKELMDLCRGGRTANLFVEKK